MKKPLLIVISAPSGGGKTSLCDRLLAEFDDIVYSVSCTTREPRGSEEEGRDYFFLSEEEFERRVDESVFLEHACVHGHMYGTLREAVAGVMVEGRSVLMDIDVQGARQVRDHVGGLGEGDVIRAGFIDIFVAPPSMDVLGGKAEGPA